MLFLRIIFSTLLVFLADSSFNRAQHHGFVALSPPSKRILKIKGLPKKNHVIYDEGQIRALAFGINPDLVMPGMTFEEFGEHDSRKNTKDQRNDWWWHYLLKGNDRTKQGVRKMLENGGPLAKEYRLYFIGKDPTFPNSSWIVPHQILHDIFLTSLNEKQRNEFLSLAFNEAKRTKRGQSLYLRDALNAYGILRPGETQKNINLRDVDSLTDLSEIFARTAGSYLGFPVPNTKDRDVQEGVFSLFFEKIGLRSDRKMIKVVRELQVAL